MIGILETMAGGNLHRLSGGRVWSVVLARASQVQGKGYYQRCSAAKRYSLCETLMFVIGLRNLAFNRLYDDVPSVSHLIRSSI